MKLNKRPHLKLSLRQKFNTTRALGITAVIMIIIGGVLFYKFGYIEDTLADKIDIKQTKNIRGAGNMIHFKHQNDVIQVPHHSSLNLRDSFTIETWFLPLGFGNNFFNDPVVGKHSSGQGWEIRAGGSDRELGFMITLPNNGCRFNHCELKSPHPLQKNIWTHVAVTYEHESSTNTSFVKLYHNGILVNEGIYTGKVSMSSIDFTIGKNIEWGNRSFNGYIDDVRYWSSVRTEAEIQQNMTVLIDPSEDNLLAYWRFDEEVNDHIIDLTGNGYDGEIIGNPELVYSSAPIGEFSIFQYDDDTPLFISDDLGNNFSLGNFNITPSTVHLYYVSENPMDDTPPSGFDGLWDQSYFGVFSFSSDTQTVTYDVILNYNDQTINIDLSIYELDIAVYPLRGNSNWDRLEGVWSMVGSLVPDWVPGGLFRMSGGGDFIEGDGEGSGNYSMGYGGSSVLPIDLLSFTAKPNENEVILNWITSTEINNSHFTILRSKEGVNFYPIQEIEGSLNSQKVVKYEFVDRDPYGGVSYYRLKQTDIDGSSEKFYIISVELYKPGDLTFVLFPNPSNGGNVYVRMDSEHINQLESTKLEVFDAQGRKVHESYKGDVSVGEQFGFIQSGELNSGVYTVRLTGGEHQVSQQLMVR